MSVGGDRWLLGQLWRFFKQAQSRYRRHRHDGVELRDYNTLTSCVPRIFFALL